MAIPTVYAPVKTQDFTLRPFTVHKKFTLTSAELVDTGSGYRVLDAVHTSLKTPIGSNKANNDPTNSFDGSYQHIIWQSLNHMYYKHPYDSYATFEHANRRFTYKHLGASASLLSMPYNDFGESIKPRSVVITNTTHGITLTDDGNGNLYDSSIDSSSFTNNYNLVGYWGFNEEFKRFKYFGGTVEKGGLEYESRTFEPDEASGIKNITFVKGVADSGVAAEFDGSSYILTANRPEFTPDKNENFSISFWVKAPVSQSHDKSASMLVSKRGVVRRDVLGVNSKYNANNLLINTRHISSSLHDETFTVYPYDIELMTSEAGTGSAGRIRFRRSNGVTTTTVFSSTDITDGHYHHVAATIGAESMSLYIDGTLESSASIDRTENIYNDASLIFGARNRNAFRGLSGSMDEIRMYDVALSNDQISTLANSSSMAMYQTAVVGNVFYRQGNVVVSPLMPSYNDTFNDTWNMTYRGTHTIFQYEVLCRVKKGSFNLTYNPTARQSFKSDLYINDMTGSLLRPYATTIGLYNQYGECVAVAKLSQAVAMRDDVDINFLVRMDA